MNTYSEKLYINLNFESSIEEKEEVLPKVYPNPTTKYLKLDAKDIDQITIVNVTGKIIAKIDNPNRQDNIIIDLSAQKKGVYILYLQTDHKTKVVKVIKE